MEILACFGGFTTGCFTLAFTGLIVGPLMRGTLIFGRLAVGALTVGRLIAGAVTVGRFFDAASLTAAILSDTATFWFVFFFVNVLVFC